MSRTRSLRATVAKAMIAIAVLVPALIVVAVALRNQMLLTGLHLRNYTVWMVADAALLGLGLLLHRGEEL